VLPSPLIDEAGWMAGALLDELADVLCEGLVVVFVLEHATATIPMIRATTTNSFERLTRLLLLLWGHTGPAFLTFSGVGGGVRPRRAARVMNPSFHVSDGSCGCQGQGVLTANSV
jgi:hypothetical protein